MNKERGAVMKLIQQARIITKGNETERMDVLFDETQIVKIAEHIDVYKRQDHRRWLPTWQMQSLLCCLITPCCNSMGRMVLLLLLLSYTFSISCLLYTSVFQNRDRAASSVSLISAPGNATICPQMRLAMRSVSCQQ